MSCDRLSLFTNVTWLPRGTVTFFGVTVLFAIVIVAADVAGGGVGAASLPPHAASAHARPHAAKNAPAMRDPIAFPHRHPVAPDRDIDL
jgi:hypothetical protein